MGVKWTPNKSQHRNLTLENKFFVPLLLLGIEPTTIRLQVWCFTKLHYSWPRGKKNNSPLANTNNTLTSYMLSPPPSKGMSTSWPTGTWGGALAGAVLKLLDIGEETSCTPLAPAAAPSVCFCGVLCARGSPGPPALSVAEESESSLCKQKDD